jgi:hypothetical protein
MDFFNWLKSDLIVSFIYGQPIRIFKRIIRQVVRLKGSPIPDKEKDDKAEPNRFKQLSFAQFCHCSATFKANKVEIN